MREDDGVMPDYRTKELKDLKEEASKFGIKPSLAKIDLVRNLE